MISDLSRTSATRLTLVTQAIAAALAAGAVGLVVIGLPDRARPSTQGPVGVPPGMPAPGSKPDTTPDVTPVAFAPVDMGGLAERLGLVANAPAEPTVDTPDEPDSGTTTPPENDPPQPFATRVRYLGMITLGSHNAAFVNIDGRQRIAKEGEVIAAPKERPELGDLTIVKVESRRIEISHDDGDAEILLAEREGSAITMAAGGEVTPVALPADPSVKVTDEFERDRPQAQIDRRRRALERQRTQDPRDYQGRGLVMPDNIRRGNIGNRNRSNDEQSEQRQPRREEPQDD